MSTLWLDSALCLPIPIPFFTLLYASPCPLMLLYTISEPLYHHTFIALFLQRVEVGTLLGLSPGLLG